jgi:hypothetical protein
MKAGRRGLLPLFHPSTLPLFLFAKYKEINHVKTIQSRISRLRQNGRNH